MASIRIEIPAHDSRLEAMASPTKLVNLTPTPDRSPESIAKKITEREATNKKLHDLHIENITERAKRANERVKEGVARKLRLEAAKVEKASSSLERAQIHVDAKQEAKRAALDAAKARRQSLLDAVRATREARQMDQLARQASLAELEDKAHAKRTKVIRATADKGRATVHHAVAVVEARKSREAEAASGAKAKMYEKQAAAEQRRTELHEAAGEAAARAAKVRLAKLLDEKEGLQAKRVKLATSMGHALGKRAWLIDRIAARARAANERVASVVSDLKTERDELTPASLRHTLVARMQSADVNRQRAQTDKVHKIIAASVGLPTSRPKEHHAGGSPTPSPFGDAGARKIRWLGPNGGCGYIAPAIAGGGVPLSLRMPQLTKEPVAFLIPLCGPTMRLAPPAALAARLSFHPKLLLATAPARHAGAAGRRMLIRTFKVTQAAVYGTDRKSVV